MPDPAALNPREPLLWVVCLCAAWCGVCRDYQPRFDALARAWPKLRFVWLDIEDQSDLLGDVDIETFPTLVIAGEYGIQFAGALDPHPGALSRLIEALQTDAALGAAPPHATDFSVLLRTLNASRL
jgi:thioredoxin 1